MTAPHEALLLWSARQFASEDAGEPPIADMDSADWSAFLRAGIDQFVLPVAWRALEPWSRSLPDTIATDLRTGFDANGIRNLRLAGELVELLNLLKAAGVQAVPWKGALLAERAYGDLRLRQFFDLDLLVKAGDLLRARDALAAARYHVSMAMTDRQLQAYVDHMGELELERESDGMWVELHTQIVPSYFSRGRSSDELWRRLVPARVARARVMALDPIDDLEALAIHGSKHRWDRLAWIVDIAVMSRQFGDADCLRLIDIARSHGTLRMVTLALVVAERVCGAPLPRPFEDEARHDRVAALLAQEVERNLFSPDLGTTAELSFHFRMRERPSDQLRYLLNVMYTPSANDWQSFALPRALFPLYLLVRPLRLFATFALRPISRLR